MISVPTNDRYVLFSVEGGDLYSYQLVHVTGTAKLIELPIEEKHVPNIFLSAAMVSDTQLFVDTKQVIVPPVQQFLSVDVKADREQYQPREEGSFSITTRDANGKAVAAEIALGLIDESVKYIQQDYAGDPRQFYYGTKRAQTIQTQSTFNQKSYASLVEVAKGQLRDRKDLDREDDERRQTGAGGDKFKEERAGYRDEFGANKSADVTRVDGLAVSETSINGAVGSAKPVAAPAPASGARNGREAPEQEPGKEPAVQVRNDFRSTILWQPDIRTDENGNATVKVKYPDSLTTWSATARVVTAGNQFGIGDTSTRTKQPLIVRLEAPRFFVVGDQVTVSGVINNNTDQPMLVGPSLIAEGLIVGGWSLTARQ